MKMAVDVRPLSCNYYVSVTRFFSKTVLRACETESRDKSPDFIPPHSGHRTVQTWVQCGSWCKRRSIIYQHRIRDADELRECSCVCMGRTWPATWQWLTRLHAYTDGKGGCFEHSLSYVTSINTCCIYVHVSLFLVLVANCLSFQLSTRRALIFTKPHDFSQYILSLHYSVFILKVWWEIFQEFNMANCEELWPKFR